MPEIRKQKILAQRVESVYRHTFTLVVSHPLAACIIAWLFRKSIDQMALIAWVALISCLAIIRLPLYFRYRQEAHLPERVVFWHRMFIVLTALQGGFYGFAWLFFIPVPNPVMGVIVAVWMVGLSANVVVGYAADWRAMLAFFIPCVVPGIVSYVVTGGMLNYAIALCVVLYTVAIMRTVYPVNRSMLASIDLNLRLSAEVAERQKVEEKLRELSLKDGLTGLANRRSFDDALLEELHRSSRNQSALTLLLIDVDFFKHYNDSYGHVEGDKCLQRLAKVLEDTVKRSGELVARFGGEEFAVILPSVDSEQARDVSHKLLSAVAALAIPHKGTEVDNTQTVTISIGFTTVTPQRGVEPQDLIHQADLALYQAKTHGRNQARSFADDSKIESLIR